MCPPQTYPHPETCSQGRSIVTETCSQGRSIVTETCSQGRSIVEVLLIRLDPEAPVPRYFHADDAGADLVTTQDLVLPPGERAVVGTGIAIALPAGYAAFVHPRSGLAARAGLGVVNAPGTIDAGYRGELQVCLVNHDLHEAVVLHRMDRIAQLVVQRVEHAEFREVTAFPVSSRGTGGYGSTGITHQGEC